ncbi:hypothetical protein WMY93_017077 [Mugilogobius chulae]|uniref:G-protein coupled receptors family 1 profile domain-containing protein n=1 Tax=Mugilogobius chulae TaxID=88201 RepID=A0AAW0NM63_9GOBI
MSEEEVMNCTISHEIHQYLFSCVYILVLLGDDWRHREWLCQVCGFLLYENIYISIGFLCCISLDRYLAVVHPLRFTSLRSMHTAWLVSALIWLKEIAVGAVFFRHKELSRDRTNQSVCFEHYPMQPWEYPINYYRFVVGFSLPLAILLVRNCHVRCSCRGKGTGAGISYLCVLRAVGRSAGTLPDQKFRIRQLVSSTILIFLVCFSPYHIFLLVRTCWRESATLSQTTVDWCTRHFARNLSRTELASQSVYGRGIFNYYHMSLLLTSLNCVADPALYCFVSESARRGLYKALVRPISRVLCCCCRRGKASPGTRPPTPTRSLRTITTAIPR